MFKLKARGGHMFRIVVSGIGNVYVLDTLDLGRVFFGLGVDWVEVATTYVLSKSMQTRGKFTFREYIHS